MAITVASTGTATLNSGVTDDVTLPGTPAEDDVYIVVYACANSTDADLAAAAGWTVLHEVTFGGPASGVLLKRMGSTPDTTVPLEAQASAGMAVVMLQVKGVDTTTALDAALTSSSGSSGMPDPPSHTTVTNDALRIVTGHLDDDAIFSASLSGWTVVWERQTSGSDCTVMAGYKLAASAGAENPGAFSGSGTDSWQASHFSLRPEAVASIAPFINHYKQMGHL